MINPLLTSKPSHDILYSSLMKVQGLESSLDLLIKFNYSVKDYTYCLCFLYHEGKTCPLSSMSA